MKSRIAVLLILIIAGGLAVSGCVGGSDENIEAWNEGVDKANEYITDGDDAREEMEAAWDDGSYSVAYDKGDDAIEYYDDALGEIDDLGDVVDAIDENFLDDYVDAWEEQMEEFINMVESQQMLIKIDEFNMMFNMFFNSYGTAEDQYFDAVDYYNEGNYQAALSTISLSEQKWTQMGTTTVNLVSVAETLDLPYAVNYTMNMNELCGHALASLENLRQASIAAQAGNYGQADNYISQQNTNNAAYFDTIDTLISIENANPNAFPDGADALSDVYNSYLASFNDAQDRIIELADEKDEITEENDDFFE